MVRRREWRLRNPAGSRRSRPRLDAWPATPAATAKEGGGGRGAEEAAGALFRARTAADAIRSALAQTRQALQSPDMKSAVVNTDLEAPYAEYERGLAGLLEKRRAAEAALTAIVSEYVDRTLPAPAATAKEGGGGRGAEEAAGALFRARTAADAIRSALAQTRQALQSPDMKSAVVNTDLEAPYAEYERGLAGLH